MKNEPQNLADLQPLEVLRVIGSAPGFRAFSLILGMRIESGQSVDALRMLLAIGGEGKEAHDIIDSWPLTVADQVLSDLGISLEAEAAIRFAFCVENLRALDWPKLLVKALGLAQESKTESS